jgi:hypothetical protein
MSSRHDLLPATKGDDRAQAIENPRISFTGY